MATEQEKAEAITAISVATSTVEGALASGLLTGGGNALHVGPYPNTVLGGMRQTVLGMMDLSRQLGQRLIEEDSQPSRPIVWP